MPPARKTERVAAAVERWLSAGRYRPGDRFPSDQELARKFAVSHLTVRAALRRFVADGRLERRVGAGTLVRELHARTPVGLGGAVGIALPDASHFYGEALRSMESALLGSGRPLLLGYTAEIADRERQVLEGWAAQQVRQAIIAATVPDAAFYRGLCARGLRLVFLDRRVPGVDAPSVTTRDEDGIAALVQLLVGQGHRRIVHLAGPRGIWTADVRQRMFRDAAAAAGLRLGARAVVPAGFFVEDGYQATRRLLDEGPAPDALVAANDLAAVGALRALGERGLAVPADVSVVGYGDHLDLGRSFGLTTVRQFPERLGLDAVRLLLAPGPAKAADSVELRPELVVRSSAGPRRGS